MKSLITYLVISALLAALFVSVKSCIRADKKLKSFAYNYTKLSDSAHILQDKNNVLHARNEELRLSRQQAATFYEVQIDSMADLLGVKAKRIKSIVYVPFKVNVDSLKSALREVDTLRKVDTVFRDKKLNALMSLTKYEARAGLFKKKQYLDVHFDNPAFSPLNVYGFDITEKPKRFGIGFYLGYGWDGVRLAPSIGISIHYDLIRF